MNSRTTVIILTLLLATEAANAFSSYLNTWRSIYPNSASENGVNCALCHRSTSGGNGWNFYGWAMREERFNNGLNISAAILAIENLDSDGNGDSNLDEINADTQPGWTIGNVNTHFFKNGTTTLNQPPPSQGTPDPAAPADPFDAWIAMFNLTGNDTLKEADPDEDGSTNEDEYRLGGLPDDSSSFPNPEVTPNGGTNPSFTIDVRIDDNNLTFTPKWSRTLSSFNDTNFTTTSDAASPFGSSYVRRTFNTDLTNEAILFFRMEE
ncbi:MAG: hypothetical protein AAGC74_10480 [Verrucomicrobiota bacterium]